MSETKPRRWFQIHLSTAVVLMLVAAVWVGFNSRQHGPWYEYGYGYPEIFYVVWADYDGFDHWQWIELAEDVGCVLLSLGLVAVPLEYLIRRREARPR